MVTFTKYHPFFDDFPLVSHSSFTKNIIARRIFGIKVHLLPLIFILLFNLIPFDSRCQITCATEASTTFAHNEMDGMASGTYDDPIVIRLYIHILRNDNGSGGVNALNLQEQLDFLDQIYNPWNIFFDYCVQDFLCTQCWTDLSFLKNQWITNSLDDGINCYLFPPGQGITGEAEDVGSKNFLSEVSYVTTAHELGHCLGLFHTHEGSLCPPTISTEYSPTIENSVLVPGSNCADAGDRICDTPADPICYNFDGPACTFTNPNGILDYLGNPYIDPENVLPVNFMSYNQCRSEFTSGQNVRIRDMLVFSSELAEVISPFSHLEVVTGTEEWTTPRFFNHDLLVEGSLTISTQVGFAPGYGIILEKNAYLELDGGDTYSQFC